MTGMKLNKKHDEVAGDNPEIETDRVKILVSEATSSTHTESVYDRIVERRVEASATDLKLHAMNFAQNNTFVVERSLEDADGKAKPAEYAAAMIAMADQYLAWLKA